MYSEAATYLYIYEVVCLKDKLLYKYYSENKVSLFRKRWVKLGTNKALRKLILTEVTNALRPFIYKIINKLSYELYKYWGNLIIAGGEAFNQHVKKLGDRIITSDIDTKLIPYFQGIPYTHRKYFQYLQLLKLVVWHTLGQICKNSHANFKYIHTKYLSHIEKSTTGKMFGMKFSRDDFLLRRYSILPKRNKTNSNTSKPLIDVEIFALDINIKHIDMKGNLKTQVLAGILDIPIMRPGEFGMVGSKDFRKGVTINGVKYKHVKIVTVEYLLKDIFQMKNLGLRKNKTAKDTKRFVTLLSQLGVPSNKLNANNKTLYEIGKGLIKKFKTHPITRKNRITKKTITQIINRKDTFSRYTNPMPIEKLMYFMKWGKGPLLQKNNRVVKTNVKKYYNINTARWTTPNWPYMSNSSNYRSKVPNRNPNAIVTYLQNHHSNAGMMLYGFNPRRDYDMELKLIRNILRMMSEGHEKLMKIM